jgi:hypothetical protein
MESANGHGKNAAAVKPTRKTHEFPVDASGAADGKVSADTSRSWSTRRRLAYALLALLAVLVVASVIAMFTNVDLQRIKDVMTLTLGPVAGLVGAVVGFYFGAKTGSESPGGSSSPPIQLLSGYCAPAPNVAGLVRLCGGRREGIGGGHNAVVGTGSG